MFRFLQIILIVILFRYLWRIVKRYWPSITNVDEKPKTEKETGNKPPKLHIDKSDIEDAEFTEIDDDK